MENNKSIAEISKLSGLAKAVGALFGSLTLKNATSRGSKRAGKGKKKSHQGWSIRQSPWKCDRWDEQFRVATDMFDVYVRFQGKITGTVPIEKSTIVSDIERYFLELVRKAEASTDVPLSEKRRRWDRR